MRLGLGAAYPGSLDTHTVVGHHSCAGPRAALRSPWEKSVAIRPSHFTQRMLWPLGSHSPNGPGSPVCARRSARLWAACGDSHVALVLLEPQSVRGLGADHVEVPTDL